MISFNAIPIDILTPGQYIEFDNSQALQGLSVVPNRILVMGQRLAAGTVAQGVPKQILSAAQGEGFFGRGSMLASMLAALKSANNYTECWAVALDDNGAGAFATGTTTFTGSPTANGTLNLYIAGARVQAAITSGQTVTQVATAVAAAINADTSLPVTAASAIGVVTLTARHRGESGNAIDLRVNYYLDEKIPAGLTVAIVAMSGGTTNPLVATALAAIGSEQYHTIIMPWTDSANLTALETELSNRWGPMVMKEGHAFTAAAGSHATINALGAGRNNPHLTLMGMQGSPTAPWVMASVLGAVDAFEPDPARPRQTLWLPGVLAPATESRYTREERNLHLRAGVATFTVDAGGRVLIERVVTTYKKNASNVDDPSYRDRETMGTLAYLRYDVRALIAQKFPRHKLANNGTRRGAGQAVVTPNDIRDQLLARFPLWEDAGLVEGMDQFKRDLLVERNTAEPNRVDAIIPPDVINAFRVFAASVQFRL